MGHKRWLHVMVKHQCSPGFLSQLPYLLIFLCFPQQTYSCQISSTSHVMSTLTYHLHISFFHIHETHLSLPKAPQTPLLWNQTPHLTHILDPTPIFSILLNVLLFTLLFFSNQGRQYRHSLRLVPCIHLATKSYDFVLPCQPLGQGWVTPGTRNPLL